jgi:hypothetical protein
MVKEIFGEINKTLTVSILVFVVVSLTFELVSGSSNLTNNSAPSLYSGKYSVLQSNSSKYFVDSSNPSSGYYIKIIDLITVSAKVSISRLHIIELYIPSSGSSNGHIPISYLMGSLVPSSYLGKNSVPISDIRKGFVPSLNSGKYSVMTDNQMKDSAPHYVVKLKNSNGTYTIV